ncbi:hypothetical protein ISN45_Aa01g037980 [Arabidopsis thaliana x Arabidopsis arenosa]|uniref:MORF/ORRM1/DAG-like MORF domain-containing protein n=1 Tax=Arabidopsis thaliana x Arabidopsis arenosa TaxID=1240361 RepID=A0A8T2CAG4_9BRAS|nr:hypothetical protein ISN45_Aa01g037980 [Arabidopsis thaliana x Arabidopsis arenosa]
MAISRSILRRPAKSFSSLFTRSFSSSSPLANSPAVSRSASSLLNRSRSLVAGFSALVRAGVSSAQCMSTQATSSSLNDPNPNWSNKPPKETILLDGCDFEHWLVVMEKPEGDLTRDEIIDYYIKTLAQVVGSEEEARMKIYSVSHKCYFAFGALVSEDLSYKIKELPKVRWVLPDSYLDVKSKNYGGEPFIDGKAVPYDPKYHEEWIKNNDSSNSRTRRPRTLSGTRKFERRRENVRGNQDTGDRGPPPNQGLGGAPPPPPHIGNNPNMPPHMPPPTMNQNYRGPPPPNMGQNYQGPPPPNMNQNYQGPPPPNMGQNYQGPLPPNMNQQNYQGPPPPNMNQSYQGPPPSNMGQNYRGPSPPPPNMSQNYQGPPPPNMNGGWSGHYQQNGGYQQGQGGGMQQQPYPPNRVQ